MSAAAPNTTLVRRFFEEVFNGLNQDTADAIIDRDFMAHHPAFPGGIKGPAGILQMMRMFRGAFPDLTYTVDDLVAEGDKVAARWTATGTHRGDFMGVPAKDPPATVKVVGIDLFRIDNGRLAEAWASSDMLGLMRQIGAVPPPV